MIGSVDFKAVRQQQKRENRSKKDNIPKEPKPSTSFDNNDILLLESEPNSESDRGKYDNDKDDPPPKLPLFSDKPSTSNLSNRNTSNLCVLANTLDRYAVSDRVGAAIASAVLQDYGIVSSEDSQNIIDRHKVRRARQKKRQELQKSSKVFLLRGLYFDGRKDKTLTFTDNRKRTIVEEHITLLQEPGSNYIGHLSPVSGTALSILDSLIEFLDNSSISFDSLEVVGCDGTNTNVGTKGGIISLLERRIKRPLQWFICQLHANELPLRHLLQHIDGETTGPRAFSGPIGKLLTNCEKLPIVEFSNIACELPDIDTNFELSTDQKYFHEMCLAIKNGYCSEALSKRDPGRLVHSRWLTTANRLLRLYVSTANPTQNLITLVTFIIKVYGPMWFFIKTMPSCIHGAKHVFKTIVLCNYLSDDLKNIVHKVINRNGFFGHPENIILSMLWDDRRYIRQLAYCRILKARAKTDPSQLKLRNFVVPIFNFEAKEYYELVDCQDVNWTEPPITVPLTEVQLQEIVDDPEHSAISYVKDYPCHTQAVERAVKMVTEASTTVCGYERRDGAIKSRLESRSIMPKFETKKDFPSE